MYNCFDFSSSTYICINYNKSNILYGVKNRKKKKTKTYVIYIRTKYINQYCCYHNEREKKKLVTPINNHAVNVL